MGKMVQPFGNGYDDTQPPAASAPPLEVTEDASHYIEFILLGDRENYSIKADKSAIVDSNCELARIFESGGTQAVRRIDDRKFAVTESKKENFELFIR